MEKRYALVVLFALLVGACSDKTPDSTKPPEQASAPAQADSSGVQGGADWRSVIHISDPALLREIHDFTFLCYDRAKNYSTKVPKDADTHWIGSQYYLQESYSSLHTPFFRAKWLEDIWTSDGLVKEDDALTCKEWWLDSTRGLHAKLLKVVDNPELLTHIGMWVEPVQKLKTLADFQKFIEQSMVCQNKWSEEMLIEPYNRIPENDFRAIGEMARRVGLETYLEEPALILLPKNGEIKIYDDLDVKAVFLIPGSFVVVLDADEGTIIERAKASGLKMQEYQVLTPAENHLSAFHREIIVVGNLEELRMNRDCERNPNPVCQMKPSGTIGCLVDIPESDGEGD